MFILNVYQMPEDKLVYFMDVDTLYAKLHEHLELEEDERAAELKEMVTFVYNLIKSDKM